MSSDGQVLRNRYRLDRNLESGAMGSVWLATDLTLDRPVALKELIHLDHSALAERRDRAVREARALAAVRHPAIVAIHDIFFEDDEPWIVMDFIDGRSLARIIRQRREPLNELEIARIGLPVLRGLRAAHDAGVFHRDVKPANIVVTQDNKVFLVDFGIAKISGDMTLTDQNKILGTPEFLAPEQIQGNPVTGATDLWALGVTFFCALEGYSPFQRPRDGASQPTATMVAIVSEPLPRLRSQGGLAEIVVQLLRKDPSQRARADELARALESIDGHKPWPPFPRPTPRPASRPRPTPPPAPGPAQTRVDGLQEARETVRKADPEAGAATLLGMSEQRAAEILVGCPAEVAAGLIAAIAASRPLIAGSILQMLKADRTGAVVTHLPPPTAAAILAAMPVAQSGRILSRAYARDVAGVLRELPAGIARQLVQPQAMPGPRAADVLRYVEPVTVAILIISADGRPNYELLDRLPQALRDEVRRRLQPGADGC